MKNQNWLITQKVTFYRGETWESIRVNKENIKGALKELRKRISRMSESLANFDDYLQEIDEITDNTGYIETNPIEIPKECGFSESEKIECAVSAFNECLSYLYDLGDTKVLYKGEVRKFIYIDAKFEEGNPND